MAFPDVKVAHDKSCDMMVDWLDGWMLQLSIQRCIIQSATNSNHALVNNGAQFSSSVSRLFGNKVQAKVSLD